MKYREVKPPEEPKHLDVEAVRYLDGSDGMNKADIANWMRIVSNREEIFIGHMNSAFGKPWLLIYEYRTTPETGDWFVLLKPGDWIAMDSDNDFICMADSEFQSRFAFVDNL